MQHESLLQGSPQRAMQSVLEVHLALPLHDMCEKVAVEGRVLVEQRFEVKRPLGRDELVQADLPWWQLSPVPLAVPVIGVRPLVADSLEDHPEQSTETLGLVVRSRRAHPLPNQLRFGIV